MNSRSVDSPRRLAKVGGSAPLKLAQVPDRELRDDGLGLTRRGLYDLVSSRLPADMSEVDRATVLECVGMLVFAAQKGLVEVALDIALCGGAAPQRNGPAPGGLAASTTGERPAVRPEERVAYRIDEVAALTGVSRATVCKYIGKEIATRKVGGMVLLNPDDVHRTFGFMQEKSVAPSAESLAEIEELLP